MEVWNYLRKTEDPLLNTLRVLGVELTPDQSAEYERQYHAQLRGYALLSQVRFVSGPNYQE